MTIREYLEKKPLLFDGAMGTYLMERDAAACQAGCELVNLENPALVQQVHEEYMRAGAVAIKTNTFCANERTLQTEPGQIEKIIRAGWENAVRAAENVGGDHFIFADIGPVPIEEQDNALTEYRKLVDTFLACNAKHFLFETQESSEGISEIAAYIKEKAPDSFIMVSFAASPEGYTRAGFLAEKLFWQLQENEAVDAVGFNCISGPKHLLERVRRLSQRRIKKYLTVMPNAGYPTVVEQRVYYGNNRDYFGKNLLELVQCGAEIVGGCCGTTPADIESAAKRLETGADAYGAMRQKKQAQQGQTGGKAQDEKETDACAEIAGMKNPQNSFAQKLNEGKKVVVVELDSPLEPDIDFFMEGVARYKYAGVDAIDIADCPIAKARTDSSILACKIQRELGMTAIPHMTCRDRNMNATKALLLGLNVEGVNNVLTVTGDPVPAAMRNQIKTLFSYNSAVLARHIQSLNQEVFSQNPFLISGALNINAVQFESQLAHAKKKLESGVSVLFTQPVLSERGLENLKRARKELPVRLLGGIMPVVSYRNANFMNNEMAGIEIDPEIVERYRDKNREEGEQLAYEISTRIVDAVGDYVDGYYVITPFKRVDLILRIVNYIKNRAE